LQYSLTSIATGNEDIGIRMEGYIQQEQDRELARAQAQAKQAMAANAAQVRIRMGT